MSASETSPLEAWTALQAEAQQRERQRATGHPIQITVGLASCGIAAGGMETQAAFAEAIATQGLPAELRTVGCCGHCYAEPVVIIDHPQSGFPALFYHEVNPGKVHMLVRNFLLGGDPCLEHVMGAMEANDLLPAVNDFARFGLEKRIVMERCGRIDPASIAAYLADGGYGALASALALSPAEIVARITAAGLRGRGGAGYPTGEKWRLAASQSATERHLICNADEGDPGAYMDRTLIESNPHQLIEGMLIAAYAVGASRAKIYIRAEYPLAVSTLEVALAQARQHGLLGDAILGSHFGIEIEIFQGSGAFVCGEETALIRSMEGFRGTPRHRPPYPSVSGLFDAPTVINNVKTLSIVPPIIAKGADWFRGIGTAESPGTAIFSVVGDVTHPGLVEIPMGVTLRHLIFDVCGGIPDQKHFKAAQIGGPSGGCLNETFLDTPIDFDTLAEAGAMMGSGGLVVMNAESCMVDVARFFLEFTQKESCGKCAFCRIGTHHLLTCLEALTKGKAEAGALELLQTLSEDICNGSLCGLGKTAPNPVLTSLRHFAEDYRAHLEQQRCPGLTCRPLIAHYIDLEKCARGCDACVGVCPVAAVFTTSTRKKGIDIDLCIQCGECIAACPPQYDAVRVVSPPALAPRVERPQTDPPKNAEEG
ncbi:MAG: NADH-ubiquinone oxidoreductase-F iron-sulfur binding region domain-containing protein [Desulfosarcinaceae bacterium]|nr:NADH-ubiquinone oxidoreductase-F iron-sulfur binding region domain-containing protein [Desulfosarcinaceae bacterium]